MMRRGNRDDAKTTAKASRPAKRARPRKPTPQERLTQLLLREAKTLGPRVEALEAAERARVAREVAAEKARQDYVEGLRAFAGSAMSAVDTTEAGHDAPRESADTIAKVAGEAQTLVDEMGRMTIDLARGPSVAFHIAEDYAKSAERNPFWRAIAWVLDTADAKITTRAMYGLVALLVLVVAIWLAIRWQLI